MKNNLNNRIDHHETQAFFFHSNGFPARTYGLYLKTLETWNPEAINILGADLSSLGGTMDPMVE